MFWSKDNVYASTLQKLPLSGTTVAAFYLITTTTESLGTCIYTLKLLLFSSKLIVPQQSYPMVRQHYNKLLAQKESIHLNKIYISQYYA